MLEHSALQYHRRKRSSKLSTLRFGVSLVYIVIVALGASYGGFFGWGSILLGGTVYPLVDVIRSKNIGRTAIGENLDSRRAEDLLKLYAIAQTMVIVWVLYLTTVRSYATWEWIGIALSLGTLTGGVGIPAAHELIHRRRKSSRAVGLYLLAIVNYMHFRIEHIYGHHLNVATPDDPATARRGEKLWAFIPRSVYGQLISAFRIEERLRHGVRGRRKRTNRVIQYILIQGLFLIFVGLVFGGLGVFVMVIQSIIAIIFLEATNYVEHYGLVREKLGDRFEPISYKHSWSTDSVLTNSLAFNLGLHADHHERPTRCFTQLRHISEAPQLPAGYLTMLSIAAFPMLWHRFMDHRLDAFRTSTQRVGPPRKSLNIGEN